MKKLLILFSFFIPFIVNAQVENVWLYGSTTNTNNRVTARNDFAIGRTFYLGRGDTSTSISKMNGAIMTYVTDGKPYIYENGWVSLNYGFYNIYGKGLIHASNDSTFRLGGTADSIVKFNFSNNYKLILDSLTSGVNSGLQINLGGDAKWDLLERDSATGNLIPIHIGSPGQVLTVLTGGGLGYSNSSGGATDLGYNTASTNGQITSSTGNSATIPAATHILAGLITGPEQARLDSTVTVINSGSGDSLVTASPTLDSLYFKKILIDQGPGSIVKDSSSLYQLLFNVSVDTSYVIPRSTAASSLWGNSSGSVGPAGYVGLSSPLGFLNGNIGILGGTSGQVLTSNGAGLATFQNASAGFTNPMTTLGDIIYQGSGGATRLAGNTTTTRQFLSSTGTGSISAAPVYYTPGATDVSNWLAYTPENVANKSNNTLGNSSTLYPTQNSVKSYVDAQASATLTLTNKAISGGSNTISNISEGSFAFSNITTANATTSVHGLLPVLPGNANVFLNGNGLYTTPVGTNIYNSDGSLSSSVRTMTMSGHQLVFNSGFVNLNNTAESFTGTVNYNGTSPELLLSSSILDNGFTGSGGTRSTISPVEIAQSTISAANTNVTYTKASSLYIDGPPIASTNVAITNPYSLYISSGNSYFGGGLNTNGGWLGVQNSTQDQLQFLTADGSGVGFLIGRSANSDDGNDFFIKDGFNGFVSRISINSSGKTTINGSFQLTDGTQGSGKVLVSDASGNASWGTNLTANEFTALQIGGTAITVIGTSTYMRTGNIVEVSGIFQTPSGNSGVTFNTELSVPIATTGSISSYYSSGIPGASVSDNVGNSTNFHISAGTSSTGSVIITATVNDASSHKISYHYSYKVQ